MPRRSAHGPYARPSMPSRRRSVRPLAALLAAGLVGACAPATGSHSLLGDPSPVGGQVPVTAPPPSAYVSAPATTRASTTTTSSTVAGATTTTAAPAVVATRPPRPYPE